LEEQIGALQAPRAQRSSRMPPSSRAVFSCGRCRGWSPWCRAPAASNQGAARSWKALFTAASAVCVTGLTVRDTGREFSTFGHVVILALIQLGGLGITTLSTALFLVFGQRASLSTHDIVESSFPGAARGQAPVPLGPSVRFDRRDRALLIHHPRAVDYLELGGGYLIVAAHPPASAVGKTVGTMALQERHGVALLGLWHAGQQGPPSPPVPDRTIAETDVLILAGHIDRLRALRRMQ
jgi:hypothetical protein